MDGLLIDSYLPTTLRQQIENDYYAKISAKTTLDEAIKDPAFFLLESTSMALLSDHGVIHVQNLANGVIDVLNKMNGVLMPKATPFHLNFMQGYGVILAYLHEIGLIDFSSYGQAMYPIYPLQIVFCPEFDSFVQTIWDENSANIAWKLSVLHKKGILTLDPMTILREMLGLAVCHSNSSVPSDVLNDFTQLRAQVQHMLINDMELIYAERMLKKYTDNDIEEKLAKLNETFPKDKKQETILSRFYSDFYQQSYAWLVDPHPELRELSQDVKYTLQALRCADALRPRGTLLKTSAGYQIFLNHQTGKVIYALQKGQKDQLYLLELDHSLGIGEANIASSELTPLGDLRISFHHGEFGTSEALYRVVEGVAEIINDIQKDVIMSFIDPKMMILLEGVDDNPEFSAMVAGRLITINPELQGKIRLEPSLQKADERELYHYLSVGNLTLDESQRQEIIDKVASSGHKTKDIDISKAFESVREIEIQTGETLIEANTPPGFAYIPMGEGLIGNPLGGYNPFVIHPWSIVGGTSIIRRAQRNATISAIKSLHLLMIPKEIYLKYWYFTWGQDEFIEQIKKEYNLK